MQRGIAGTFILIAIAAIFVAVAIFYGYFITFKGAEVAKETVQLPPMELIPSPLPQVGTVECPDTDYTGCDNTSQYMTWDGPSEISGITQEGTFFSK